MQLKGISIKGISATVPVKKEDNLGLPWMDEAQRQKFVETTGIRHRHIAKNITATDLCVDAAQRLLEKLDWEGDEIEILIFVTQTPDFQVPGTASQIHHRLALRKDCVTLDLNQGCAGYVYGLSMIGSMMQSLGLKKGLLLVGDTISQFISHENTTIKPIFSDAGTATALMHDDESIWNFACEVDGSRFKTIHLPKAENGRQQDLQMNGHDVFSFGLKEVAPGLKKLISENGGNETIDYLVMHQANKLLNDAIAKKLGIPKEKVPSSLYKFGNTSSATIPLTIAARMDTALFNESKTWVLAGFGVGLTWAAVYMSVKDLTCLQVHEI